MQGNGITIAFLWIWIALAVSCILYGMKVLSVPAVLMIPAVFIMCGKVTVKKSVEAEKTVESVKEAFQREHIHLALQKHQAAVVAHYQAQGQHQIAHAPVKENGSRVERHAAAQGTQHQNHRLRFPEGQQVSGALGLAAVQQLHSQEDGQDAQSGKEEEGQNALRMDVQAGDLVGIKESGGVIL